MKPETDQLRFESRLNRHRNGNDMPYVIGPQKRVAVIAMGFQFDAGLALLHTKVDDIPIGSRLVNRDAPQAPDYTVNFAATKSFEIGTGRISATFNAVYTADFYSQLTNAAVTKVPDGWLANARVSLKTMNNRLELAVFANNLFDEARKTFSFDVSAPPLGGAYDTYTQPRWMGVQARLNF
ncbi:MAG: hypothetical protein LKF30_12180 [Sphingobium sp.]|jgi:iron complex outermembrane receptor protein|nr:hypothetical protein [Sphingobium sp.]MCI1754654.1 hypothetical protein [Sphingobium sp.]MCI2054194.1 hypothetical protein [Sphingobium sp.]